MVKVTVNKKKAPRRLVKVQRAAAKPRPMIRSRAKENSNLLANFGRAAGTFLGGPVGGQLGQSAGKLISRITGFGDYKIEHNSIASGHSIPTFQTGSDGVRICHREYLGEVVGSTGFSSKSYSINPGLVATFPWLAKVAANFEEYELDGLVFEYRPSSGSAVSSTSSALGVVVMATDYDATNPPFPNKQVMESYEFSTSTVPFTGCLHPVECKRKLSVFGSNFVRTGNIGPNQDLRLFDFGNFQIATQGMQSVYTVGELWVTWDILLRKPRIPSSFPFPAFASIREDPVGTANNAENFFGTNGGKVLNDSLGISTGKNATSGLAYIQLPTPGNYLVLVTMTGQNINPVASYGSNVTVGPAIIFGGVSTSLSVSNVLSTVNTYSITVTKPGTGVENRFLLGSTAYTLAGRVSVYVTLYQDNPVLTLELLEQAATGVYVRPESRTPQNTPELKSVEPREAHKCRLSGVSDSDSRRTCPCGFELTSNGAYVYVCDECRQDEDDAENRLHEALQKFHFKPG